MAHRNLYNSPYKQRQGTAEEQMQASLTGALFMRLVHKMHKLYYQEIAVRCSPAIT